MDSNSFLGATGISTKVVIFPPRQEQARGERETGVACDKHRNSPHRLTTPHPKRVVTSSEKFTAGESSRDLIFQGRDAASNLEEWDGEMDRSFGGDMA